MPTNSVTVAGNPLENYGARMQANPVISHTRDVETFQGRQRSTMLPVKNLITGMVLKARIDFFGSASTRAMNRSNFESLFRSQTMPVEIDILDGFFYRSVLKTTADCGTAYDLINTVEYTFQVTRHKTPVTIEFRGSNTVNCISNVDKTDCILTIDGAGAADAEVAITFNSLNYYISNVLTTGGDIILDGINKRFLIGTQNVASLIEWRDFPFLVPGNNSIAIYVGASMAPSNLQCSFSYTPTFL